MEGEVAGAGMGQWWEEGAGVCVVCTEADAPSQLPLPDSAAGWPGHVLCSAAKSLPQG